MATSSSRVMAARPGTTPCATSQASKASWVSWVEASRHDAATAYAAFDRHTFGDMDPHVFMTRDYGRRWTRIAAATQGVRGYAHVIREDIVNPDLLFLGTEFGLWISLDRGAHWAAFKGGRFPSVAVRDLAIQPRDHDLVIATHGRGIWIIDDLTPLRHLDATTLAAEVSLFLPSRPRSSSASGFGGWSRGDAVFVGRNAPNAAVISYHQKRGTCSASSSSKSSMPRASSSTRCRRPSAAASTACSGR